MQEDTATGRRLPVQQTTAIRQGISKENVMADLKPATLANTTWTPTTKNQSYSGSAMEATRKVVSNARGTLDQFQTLNEMDELTMIQYNLAASKYSTMVSMSSGLVKNLSDTEKQVANKM
jgi:hypothetical protein